MRIVIYSLLKHARPEQLMNRDDRATRSLSGIMGAKFANAVASTVEDFSSASKATFVSSLFTQLDELSISEKEKSPKKEHIEWEWM